MMESFSAVVYDYSAAMQLPSKKMMLPMHIEFCCSGAEYDKPLIVNLQLLQNDIVAGNDCVNKMHKNARSAKSFV